MPSTILSLFGLSHDDESQRDLGLSSNLLAYVLKVSGFAHFSDENESSV